MFNRAAAYAADELRQEHAVDRVPATVARRTAATAASRWPAASTSPYGVAIDSQNRVYVADSALHAVRRINADGTVTTIAGTGTSGQHR